MNKLKKLRAIFSGKFSDASQHAEDTKRLDWMINNRARVAYNTDEEGGKQWFSVYATCQETGYLSRCYGPARNVKCARAAIDFAMKGKE